MLVEVAVATTLVVAMERLQLVQREQQKRLQTLNSSSTWWWCSNSSKLLGVQVQMAVTMGQQDLITLLSKVDMALVVLSLLHLKLQATLVAGLLLNSSSQGLNQPPPWILTLAALCVLLYLLPTCRQNHRRLQAVRALVLVQVQVAHGARVVAATATTQAVEVEVEVVGPRVGKEEEKVVVVVHLIQLALALCVLQACCWSLSVWLLVQQPQISCLPSCTAVMVVQLWVLGMLLLLLQLQLLLLHLPLFLFQRPSLCTAAAAAVLRHPSLQLLQPLWLVAEVVVVLQIQLVRLTQHQPPRLLSPLPLQPTQKQSCVVSLVLLQSP
jgi:hypothetical protein